MVGGTAGVSARLASVVDGNKTEQNILIFYQRREMNKYLQSFINKTNSPIEKSAVTSILMCFRAKTCHQNSLPSTQHRWEKSTMHTKRYGGEGEI